MLQSVTIHEQIAEEKYKYWRQRATHGLRLFKIQIMELHNSIGITGKADLISVWAKKQPSPAALMAVLASLTDAFLTEEQ